MNNIILTPMEKKQCFDAFIDEFKEKKIIDKQNLIISDFKELIALFQQLCNMYGYDSELLINREILDVNRENYTQEDFSEAVYVYLQIFKEIMSSFLIPIVDNNLLVVSD